MNSTEKTVEDYIDSLPDERRAAITIVRKTILKNLPKGYEEVMNWGMITYEIPLTIEPDTYNGKPLLYAALASQKNHMAVYLTSIFGNEEMEKSFRDDYKKTGKKLDMGKSCVRFKKLEDLPLDLIGATIASTSVDAAIAIHKKFH